MRSALIAWSLLLLAPLSAAQGPERAAAPAAPAATAAKAPRLALVIGNAKYKDAPLVNPVNDATDVASALEASGFTVMKRENASLREMHLALREFGDRLGRLSTGLFYFSGHGLQVRGRNYLLPVDADIEREDEVAFQALDLGAVMEKLDSAKNPVNIVVLDACRNNPFGNRLQASAKGLAQVDAPPGTLIAFSTAPGSTAADGTGRNGLYTMHLVRQMQRPGLSIEEVFKGTRAAVRVESKNAQIPWESTSLESEFSFRAAPAAPAPKPSVAAARPAAPSAPRALPPAPGAPPNFAPGDKWTYRAVNLLDGTERRFTVSVKGLKDGEVLYGNDEAGDLFGNYTRVKRRDGTYELWKPSTQAYVFPLVAGAQQKLRSVEEVGTRTFDLEIDLRVAGEEELETPLGKVRGVRIERIARWQERGAKGAGVNTSTYWYNAAWKRSVRTERRNVTGAGKVLQHERVEMVAAELK